MPRPATQRGIQSVEVGGRLLLALAQHGAPMALKDLALAAGMAPAKAHPYLVSFSKLSLIEQDGASGRYGLGPLALQLGLIALHQHDPLRQASAEIEGLAHALGHTVAIAVWGEHGPVIVRVAPAPTAVHVAMRHGAVMSLTGTASGWAFAAYLPEAATRSLRPRSLARAEFAARTEEVRRHGIARAIDLSVVGVSAMAAPVFDARGHIVLALTTIGPTAAFDARWDGLVAQTLRGAAAALSQRLGGLPAAA